MRRMSMITLLALSSALVACEGEQQAVDDSQENLRRGHLGDAGTSGSRSRGDERDDRDEDTDEAADETLADGGRRHGHAGDSRDGGWQRGRDEDEDDDHDERCQGGWWQHGRHRGRGKGDGGVRFGNGPRLPGFDAGTR